MEHQMRLWALQESGAENHSDLKEPLVGVHRQKTQTTYNIPIIFKIKHVVKYARGATTFQRHYAEISPSFNHAFSVSHHLERERNLKGITQTFLVMQQFLGTANSLNVSISLVLQSV